MGSFAGVCETEQTWRVDYAVRGWLVVESRVSREDGVPAGAVAVENVAALEDEVGDEPVEGCEAVRFRGGRVRGTEG